MQLTGGGGGFFEIAAFFMPFHYLFGVEMGAVHVYPDWKVCSLEEKDIFPRRICALRKTTLAGPLHMKQYLFVGTYPLDQYIFQILLA